MNINAKIEESLDDFIANTFSAYSKNKYILDNHIRPQNEFICANTTIFHFEDGLESIIKWLENELSITFEFPTMPNTQTSITNKSKIDVNVSIETDEKIKRFYKEDYLICSP